MNNVDIRHDAQYQFYTAYGDYYRKPVSQKKPTQKVDAPTSIEEDDY